MRNLQNLLTDISFDSLPAAWTTFDLAAFSRDKRLFDYQQEALQFALCGLWKYYEDFGDYRPDESDAANAERKERFFEWYQLNNDEIDLDIPVDRQNRDIRNLLTDYYPVQNGYISYQHFINRMCFWMATGSGKTLIIIKLLELLWMLGRTGEIPRHNILVLAHQDELLEQLSAHVDDFNTRSEVYIRLRDLREYPEAKREVSTLFRDQEATVFIYRSDNLSNEQKERIIDFRNYDDHGHWFILLDEAHKGDREESKRQHIYSILSRNGFLFNFSATFADDRDYLTTAYNFNLARFIESGYGKHIAILKQENRAFKDKEDYTDTEKQKIVIKALLMLTYVRLAYEEVQQADDRVFYHRPLMLTLVNSVNTEDSDLKLFFRELKRFGKGEIDEQIWMKAKEELWQELSEGQQLMFEPEHFTVNQALFETLTPQDVLRAVYNASDFGEIEVWVRPSDRKQLAFKLKNAERPFALIKIGDIAPWLKGELDGYDVLEGFEDEGFFQRLNENDSDINILMGSRSFYEGWDSNRPNVITFINIGTGTDARKFILQSVGRGVRIEPLTGQRKRLQNLYNADNEEAHALYPRLRSKVLPLETLFIFGTNRQALYSVIEQLDLEQGEKKVHQIALEVNKDAVNDHPMLIPTYRQANHFLIEQKTTRKFEIAADELDLLKHYVSYLNDNRLLVALHGATPRQVGLLHQCLENPNQYFNTNNGRRYGWIDIALNRLFGYFQVVPKETDDFKLLEDEINHFQHIKVLLKDITELQVKIARAKDRPHRIAELRAKYNAGELDFDELLQQIQSLPDTETLHTNGYTLQIKHVAHHYYTPLLLSDNVKIDFIRHIIRYPSEVHFINNLERYLQQSDNKFHDFDWWLFSKIDENLDTVYIPYYDPEANRIRDFKPDFIFWLQKGEKYFIVFVDPKGTKHTDFEHKVDGYKMVFEDELGKPRIFSYNGLKVQVYLFLYTEDVGRLPKGYRAYWTDNPENIIQNIVCY